MKIIAIILVIGFALFLDAVLALLTFLGIPLFIANLLPIILIGVVLEQFSAGVTHRTGIGKVLRIIIFGAIISFLMLTSMAWILRVLLLFVVGSIAIIT